MHLAVCKGEERAAAAIFENRTTGSVRRKRGPGREALNAPSMRQPPGATTTKIDLQVCNAAVVLYASHEAAASS